MVFIPLLKLSPSVQYYISTWGRAHWTGASESPTVSQLLHPSFCEVYLWFVFFARNVNVRSGQFLSFLNVPIGNQVQPVRSTFKLDPYRRSA